jgi:hypothetical protein
MRDISDKHAKKQGETCELTIFANDNDLQQIGFFLIIPPHKFIKAAIA